MTNLTNINRDAFWSNNEQYLSANTDFFFTDLEARTNSLTYTNIGTVTSTAGFSPNVPQDRCAALGVMFNPFDDENQDNVMFRIKCWAAMAAGEQPGSVEPAYVFWGHGFVTSMNAEFAVLQTQTYYPIKDNVDEVLCLRRPAAGSPNEGLPICFYFGCGETSGNPLHGSLCVQNMSVGPDPYAIANW